MLRQLGEIYEQIEAIAGVAAAFFIGFTPPCVLFMLMLAGFAEHVAWGLAAMAAFIASAVMAAWVTRLAGNSLYRRYPHFRPASWKDDTAAKRRMLKRRAAIEETCSHKLTLEEKRRGESVEALQDQVRVITETLDEMFERETRPVALLVAERLDEVPLLLRPVLSAWWLAHFIGGAYLGLSLSRVTIDAMQNPGNGWFVVLPLGFQIALLFAVNLYLIMAVAVLIPSPWLHELVWRWRFVFDLVVSMWTIVLVG